MNKVYVISDIHGQNELFYELLKTIHFTKSDTLYILGDCIDKGPGSIDLLKYIRTKKNIHLIKGNHEAMMLESLQIQKSDSTVTDKIVCYLDWLRNGGSNTLEQYRAETPYMQKKLYEYLENLPDYKLLNVKGEEYLLIHAGLFIPKEDIPLDILLNANIENEMHLYVREDFLCSHNRLKDINIIFGHTPTYGLPSLIPDIKTPNIESCNANRIYIGNGKIGIDGRCYRKDGNLICYCLTDKKTIYIKNKN